MAATQSKTNWFAIWISVAVVVVLVGVGAVVIAINNAANDPGPAPESQLVDPETGAITFGGGDKTVAVYIDFICPACNQFEQTYGTDLMQLAEDGKITLEYHPIAILDHRSQGTKYSSRASGAMFSVATYAPESAAAYLQTLFQNQPAEGSTGLTDEQLADYATQVGADAAVDSIMDGEFDKYPASQAKSNEIEGTPTIEIDGKRLDLQNSQDDLAAFNALFD